MQLLLEEFFGKIWKFIREIKVIPIRIVAKLILYLLILGIFSLLAWMIYTKKYLWLMVFIVVILLGEIAHFIRKSRETVMNKMIEVDNDLEDEARNPLNKGGMVLNKEKRINEEKIKKALKEKVLNKEGLLSKKP